MSGFVYCENLTAEIWCIAKDLILDILCILKIMLFQSFFFVLGHLLLRDFTISGNAISCKWGNLMLKRFFLCIVTISWQRFLSCPLRVSGGCALRFAIIISSPSSLRVIRAVWGLIESFQSFKGILKYLQRSRFAQGPVAPRYSAVFDLTLIFDYILSLGSYVGASFESLRLRTIVLLRIDLMCRSADLGCVHWGSVSVSGGDIENSLRLGFCKNKVWRGKAGLHFSYGFGFCAY